MVLFQPGHQGLQLLSFLGGLEGRLDFGSELRDSLGLGQADSPQFLHFLTGTVLPNLGQLLLRSLILRAAHWVLACKFDSLALQSFRVQFPLEGDLTTQVLSFRLQLVDFPLQKPLHRGRILLINGLDSAAPSSLFGLTLLRSVVLSALHCRLHAFLYQVRFFSLQFQDLEDQRTLKKSGCPGLWEGQTDLGLGFPNVLRDVYIQSVLAEFTVLVSQEQSQTHVLVLHCSIVMLLDSCRQGEVLVDNHDRRALVNLGACRLVASLQPQPDIPLCPGWEGHRNQFEKKATGSLHLAYRIIQNGPSLWAPQIIVPVSRSQTYQYLKDFMIKISYMEQVDFNKQVGVLFGVFTPSPATVDRAISVITQLDKKGDLKGFLAYLPQHLTTISQRFLFKYLRFLKGLLKSKRNTELGPLFAKVVREAARKYIYGSVVSLKEIKHLRRFADLLSGIPTETVVDDNDHLLINLELARNQPVSAALDSQVWQKLQREILVDKKSRVQDSIPLNPLLSKVVAPHSKETYEILKKLLMRSSANLSLWNEISEVASHAQSTGQMTLQCFNVLQEQLSENSEACVEILKDLTSNLNNEATINSLIDQIDRLISKTYDQAKKTLYILMLQGVSVSALRFQSSKTKLLQLLIGLQSTVDSEDLFNILSPIVRKFMQSNIEGDTDTVDKFNKELKVASKYGMLILSNIISEIHLSPEVRGSKSFTSLIQEVKSQYNKANSKIGLNVESYLATVNILASSNAVQTFPEFAQSSALTNFVFAGIESELKTHFSKTVSKLIPLNPKLGHQETLLAISTFSSFVKSDYRPGVLIDQLSCQNILWLLTQGVYPIAFYQLQKPLKLNWHQSQKIVRQLLKSIRSEQIDIAAVDWQRFISILAYFKIPNSKEVIANKFPKHFEQIKSLIHGRVTEVINIILHQETVHNQQFSLYINFLRIGLSLGLCGVLQPYVKVLFGCDNYTEVKCLEKLDKQIDSDFAKSKAQLVSERQRLSDRQFPLKAATKISVDEEQLKMLDENEVKQQILRKHFQRMRQYYNKLMLIVRSAIADHSFQVYICDFYSQLLECQIYPQLRPQFNLFNRNLFDAQPQYRRHSEFLSELYINIGMRVIPSATVLDKLNAFMSALLAIEFKSIPSHFVGILEYLTQYILKQSFDISLKLFSVKFYLRLSKEERFRSALENIYPLVIQNINLLSQFQETQILLVQILKAIPEQRLSELLDDLLNYLQSSKRTALTSVILSGKTYQLNFEDYVKLRIVESENEDVSKLASQILAKFPLVLTIDQLKKFKMARFVERHSKEVSERLCSFAKEIFEDPSTIQPMFDKVIQTAEALYEQKFDEEGLEFYPCFLLINLEFIPSNRLQNIFLMLIKYYTADDQMVSLNKKSMEAGIAIIKTYGSKQAGSLLSILENLMKSNQGIASIIFLGVLAPYLKQAKNLDIIQKRITQIYDSDNENIQRSVSKCMHELMSFFKQPDQLVAGLYEKVVIVDSDKQVGQAYLISGLLKGIGIKQVMEYLDKTLEPSNPKNIVEKKGKLYILSALFDNFGRAMEPKITQIIKMIAVSMSDNNETVRDISKETAKRIMTKLSAFAVKIILPQLLSGLQQQEHWRGKTTYIWILGNMSHCAPRQLHACLPKIIPTLSGCLSDTHPKIRETATEALKVIGQTIKNPEIFNNIDVLINALSDPFNMSKKALQILLKTRFSHFIDPPAMSVIVPILNYALRGRDTLLKQYACQVIGSMVLLIEKAEDLLPYLEFMSEGIRITLCDPLPHIRSFASRAIGKISSKIGIEHTGKYLAFIKEILQSSTATSVERQGAAQGLSEYICAHGMEYFEESLVEVYKKLQVAKSSQKQGYISIFIYVPAVMKGDFEPFIKELTDNMTIFVSDEEESIRNSSLQVQKILINNFGLSHTEMLLEPLQQNLFEDRWRKRNGALLLIGEMLNVLKNYLYENIDAQKDSSYYGAIMGVYILKDDQVEMPRITANQIWNTYIQNTPKTIKNGIPFLVRMWSKGISQPASGIVFRNIASFCLKYAQTLFTQILSHIQDILSDPVYQSGGFEVLGEFIKRMLSVFLSKYKENFRSIFDKYLFAGEGTYPKLVQTLAIYVDKMHESEYLATKIDPILALCDTISEQDPVFSTNLHLFASLCSTSSKNITELVAKKILQSPLSEFKIQILLNNSGRLANYAYSKGIINILRKEILGQIQAQSPRLKSLVYCMKQLSSSMDDKNKNDFLRSLSSGIRGISKTPFSQLSTMEQRILEVDLDLLNHYLETVTAEETPSLEELIEEISPLCLTKSPTIIETVNKIMLRLFMHPDARTKSIFFKEFIRTMESSQVVDNPEVIPIWSNGPSVQSYTTLFVNSLCYGGIEVFTATLSMIQLFFKLASPQFVKQQAVRFVGATLRVANYRLSSQQRVQLHKFIRLLYRQKFPLQGFQFQVSFILFKFLEDTEDSDDIKLAAETFTQMLVLSSRKNDILSEFVRGILRGKEYIGRCLFFVVKYVISRQVASQSILTKLYTQLSQILEGETDMQIQSIYYISRTAARLSVYLKMTVDDFKSVLGGVTYSYTNLLRYLHFCQYAMLVPSQMDKIQLFLKDSSREKVHFLLKTVVHLTKRFPVLKEKYHAENLKKMMNESILGFQEIEQCLHLLL